jgi:hypothetical protein
LDDVLDETNYVSEENSSNAQRMNKFRKSDPGDMTSIKFENETADMQGSRTVKQNRTIRDDNCTFLWIYWHLNSEPLGASDLK